MVIGLDVSSSVIGVSIFNEDKSLYKLFYVDLHKKENLYEKKNTFKKHIEPYKGLITECFIEEPLLNTGISRSRKTTVTLIQFNGMISDCIYNELAVIPVHISVYNVRKIFFPEYVSYKKVKGETKSTLSLPLGVNKKELVWRKVTSMEPNFQWIYNKKGKLCTENFDMSDAYAVGYAGFTLDKTNLDE